MTRTCLKTIMDAAEHPGPPASNIYQPTSVFLLVFDDQKPHILAIQKADTEGYPWRNQVALPGGIVDPDDRTAQDACFRELKEELGISRDQVAPTGSIGHFQTIKDHDIEAFSGFWDRRGPIVSKTVEISRVLEIPVSDLMDIHIARQFHGWIPDIFDLQYPVQDVTIWGVTARIIHHFLEMIYGCRSGLDPCP